MNCELQERLSVLAIHISLERDAQNVKKRRKALEKTATILEKNQLRSVRSLKAGCAYLEKKINDYKSRVPANTAKYFLLGE